MEADLVAIADLGVTGRAVRDARGGSPNPSPVSTDWSLWDRAFARHVRPPALEPIVEFLHFGLPDHHPGFVDRAWIDSFVRYVTAFLDRYPAPRWFTPINEPGITARLSARFGIWNDMAATSEAHAQALANIVQANLEAMALIRTDRNGWWVGSEGFDIPVAMNDSPGGSGGCRPHSHARLARLGPSLRSRISRRRLLRWPRHGSTCAHPIAGSTRPPRRRARHLPDLSRAGRR